MPIAKNEIFDEIRSEIQNHGLRIQREDQTRPWGGFFVLDENDIVRFLQLFFPNVKADDVKGSKLSPKVLVVAPHSRLSWQYHNRRSELWTIMRGPVGIAMSDTDHQNEPLTFSNQSTISLKQGQRHRLIGSDNWGVVAEIWQHTDPKFPSNEEDIVRVQDDYNR